jgi:hypothetical protein
MVNGSLELDFPENNQYHIVIRRAYIVDNRSLSREISCPQSRYLGYNFVNHVHNMNMEQLGVAIAVASVGDLSDSHLAPSATPWF